MTASLIKLKSTFLALRQAFPLAFVLIYGFVQMGTAQNSNFKIFKNFFVTGDYVLPAGSRELRMEAAMRQV